MERDSSPTAWFVTLGEIVFAVVLGASLIEFNEFLFPPVGSSPNFWALVVVYITVVTSWTGWHKSISNYPYSDTRLGIARAIVDVLIVIVYVALFYFGSRVKESLLGYLWGFFVVFLLYWISGKLRRSETHDPHASQLLKIQVHGAVTLVLAAIYTILSPQVAQLPTAMCWVFVFLPLVTMLSYRYFREWRALAWSAPHVLAIDVDGVLAEQVTPVLEKLKKEMNVELYKNDIVDWEYPFNKTNIRVEIERAEREEEFVQKMQPIEGAIEATKILSEKFDVVVATSRETLTDPWTRDWLNSQGIPYRALINTRSRGKSLSGVDFLIDDHIKNIEDFIRDGPLGRQAILFAQPWNRDISRISDLLASGKVEIAHSWHTVLALLGLGSSEAKTINGDRQKFESQDETIRDYFGLQALSCFFASFLFLRINTLSGEGASLFLEGVDWLHIPFAAAFLALSFFFIAVAFVPQLQRMAKRILKVFGFPISVVSMACVIVAWVDGIKGLRAYGPWFEVFFWAGFAFFLVYGGYFIFLSWRYARMSKTKS